VGGEGLFPVVIIRETDDVGFRRGADPDLHEAGRLISGVPDPVRRPAGDVDLLAGRRRPDALADSDLQAGV